MTMMTERTLKSLDDRVEVRGQLLVTIIETFGPEKTHHYVDSHDLMWVSPDEWYPQQLLVDIFNDLNATFPEVDFQDLGRQTARALQLDHLMPHTHFSRVVNALNAHHKLNHRNGEAGQFSVELLDTTHVIVDARVPYPDDFIYGELYQLALEHLPPDTEFQLYYDENISRRDGGGYMTRIHVVWE